MSKKRDLTPFLQLRTRTWSGGGIAPARTDYSYDARGGRSLMERFSDVTGTQKIGSTRHEFDAVGNLTDLTHLTAVDAVFSDFHFDWSLASEMTARTEDGENTNYLHDASGQLTSADYATQTDEAYSYDANGNRQAAGLTVGPNNQVLADSTYTYQYDAEGNLTRRTETATGQYTQYTFDFRNRMVAATGFSAGGTVLQNVDFAYDVFDRRMTKTVDVDGAGPLAPVTTHTVYDGQHAWADLDAAGNTVAGYLFGPSIDEIVARWSPASGTAWYITDQVGSVRSLLNATGTVINSISYDSFGNMVSFTDSTGAAVSLLDPQSSSLLRFTFTGREFDAELGFYYYRARYYDPQLGRFISQDPIAFAAGDTNLYRYVGNSPLTFVDPSGNDQVFYAGAASEDSRLIASGLGAVFGFACGWVSGWYSVPENENDGVKFEAALSAAMEYYAWGAAIGYALGPIAAAVPQFSLLQTGGFLTISIALTIRETQQMAADDRNNGVSHEGIWRKQVACVIAPAVAGGVIAALDDIAKLRQPVSRFLNSETGTFDPSFSLGKPSGSSPRIGGRYVYDAATGNYRDLRTGRFVAPRNLPWPANAGFASSTRQALPAGTVLDRFGSPSGRFLSQPGATISQRGMAAGSEALPYTQYRVLKPFDAQVGPAAGAPDFNAVGGATQYLPGKSVQWLVDNNFLQVIK